MGAFYTVGSAPFGGRQRQIPAPGAFGAGIRRRNRCWLLAWVSIPIPECGRNEVRYAYVPEKEASKGSRHPEQSARSLQQLPIAAAGRIPETRGSVLRGAAPYAMYEPADSSNLIPFSTIFRIFDQKVWDVRIVFLLLPPILRVARHLSINQTNSL